jgi:hypothetical protein
MASVVALTRELTDVWNEQPRSPKKAGNVEYRVARIVAFADNPRRRTSADLKSGPERDVGRGSIKVASFVIFFQERRVLSGSFACSARRLAVG